MMSFPGFARSFAHGIAQVTGKYFELAVFPRCSLLKYRFRYARRSRLEKQPTDLRRKTCLFWGQDIRGIMTPMRSFHAINRLGLVSDTHGLLRDSVRTALTGVDLILHAGDIGRRGVLEELESIAPVVAVRGNVDSTFADLPPTEIVSVNDELIYILHDLATLDLVPEKAGIWMVVSGHSHKAWVEKKNGVLYVNPGSIGPRRFRLPITYVTIAYGGIEPVVELVELA
jgi:putative phosphoesterase